ncbi:hypothetical protein AADZ91_12725 [Colwelliaceae bacterium 6441]
MLLRIIDIEKSNSVNIILENDENYIIEEYSIESYSSPTSLNFRKSLSTYFKNYLSNGVNSNNDKIDVERLISRGKSFGDELLGEDHQLIKVTEIIDENNYQSLDVQIESNRISFFNELWELTILPDSKYFLSTVVRSFIRKLTEQSINEALPECSYQLNVSSNADDNLSQILNVDQNEQKNKQKTDDKPLNILYVVSRENVKGCGSYAINSSFEAINAGGIINYDIQQFTNSSLLKNRLADKNTPIHILHYDGPIIIENGVPSIILGNETKNEYITVKKLSSILAKHKIALLCIDARAYISTESKFPNEWLAMIAKISFQQGLGNIIGLSEIPEPWTSKQCFDSLYGQLSKGHNLAQAVIEARKLLQTDNNTSIASIQAIDSHIWPLLVHYSRQSIQFFKSNQIVDNNLRPKFSFNDNVFGFRSDMLPPLLDQVGDGQVLTLINKMINTPIANEKVINITGEAGSGKTQLAHVTNLYLTEQKHIDYSFYFDFSSQFYSRDDILTMIAPILQLRQEKLSLVLDKLSKYKCSFVFDELEFKANRLSQDLHDFINKTLSDNHLVIILNKSNPNLNALALFEIKTIPLTTFEQKVIATDSLKLSDIPHDKLLKIESSDEWRHLLPAINGHPWLAKKTPPLLATYKASDIKDMLTSLFNSEEKRSIIEMFYQNQWESFPPIWQKFLLLCSETPGILLEMLMTVIDRKNIFEPAKSLFSIFNETKISFSQGLKLWKTSGFTSQFPHGKVIEQSSINFLKNKRLQENKTNDDSLIRLFFSQVICEGVRILTQHVIKQPNQNISNNLLVNRNHWAKHFETLWFNHDYRGFMNVKNTFDQLLLQNNLKNESQAWSLNLLERSLCPSKLELEGQVSWLSLAIAAVELNNTKDEDCISDGKKYWLHWFDSVDAISEKHNLVIFNYAAIFLEKTFQNQKDWDKCINLCEKSYNTFHHYKAWNKVINSLASLSKYHYNQGKNEEAVFYENKILTELSYHDYPPDYKIQQMLNILFIRLDNQMIHLAQELLDTISKLDNSEKISNILDEIQCEIFFQGKKYLQALPFYVDIWSNAIITGQQNKTNYLHQKLLKISNEVEETTFNINFELKLPTDIPSPKVYVP